MKVAFVLEHLPQAMLGVMWLGRAVKDAGHQSLAFFVPDSNWLSSLRAYRPDVVAYSVATGRQLYFAELNNQVRQALPGVFTLMGGPHPTFAPEILEHNEGLDAICRGEGEEALGELLGQLAAGESPYGVRNLWLRHRETGEIIKNSQRPPPQDLDRLGFPDRSLLYDQSSAYRHNPRKTFLTSRSCPLSCSFCFHHGLLRKVYNAVTVKYVRKRSVDHVLSEIKEVKARYGLEFVHFVDDTFNTSEEWLEEFCWRYPREIGLPFDVVLMVNGTKERHIAILKRAGCVYARIAFESANEFLRNTVLRKNTTLDELRELSLWIKRHGIRLGSFNVVGAPSVSLADELATVRLNIECKVDQALVALLQPYLPHSLSDYSSAGTQAGAAFDDEHPLDGRDLRSPKAKRAVDNLHKLFPIVVRFPWLMPCLPRLIHYNFLAYGYRFCAWLFAEFQAAEQARTYDRAQGKYGPTSWTVIVLGRRLIARLRLILREGVRGKPQSHYALATQLAQERVVAHMD